MAKFEGLPAWESMTRRRTPWVRGLRPRPALGVVRRPPREARRPEQGAGAEPARRAA